MRLMRIYVWLFPTKYPVYSACLLKLEISVSKTFSSHGAPILLFIFLRTPEANTANNE